MASINDPTSTPLNAALEAGVDTLSLSQTITFTKYVKLVLPYDGFVFWVRADQVSPGALLNASQYNRRFYNEPTAVVSAAATMTVKGSLHYTTDQAQEETETFGRNQVVFNAESEVVDLNEVSPVVMWIGTFEGIQFAFTRRASFYQQAGIYHYRGDAIYPSMRSQIVDDVRAFDAQQYVISNSLPVWLALSRYMPMYPSYLVRENIEPPFAAVHIGDDDTEAIQSAPLIAADSSHYQLAKDRVRITTYGLRNNEIMDFLDYVNAYSLDTDVIGLMNMPIVRDAKVIQSELNIIAMKKVLEFEVSYYQTRVADVARQLIESAFITFNPT